MWAAQHQSRDSSHSKSSRDEERTTASGGTKAAQETTGTSRDARTDGNTTNRKYVNQRRDTSNTRELRVNNSKDVNNIRDSDTLETPVADRTSAAVETSVTSETL
jgi:hypothetical protein